MSRIGLQTTIRQSLSFCFVTLDYFLFEKTFFKLVNFPALDKCDMVITQKTQHKTIKNRGKASKYAVAMATSAAGGVSVIIALRHSEVRSIRAREWHSDVDPRRIQ